MPVSTTFFMRWIETSDSKESIQNKIKIYIYETSLPELIYKAVRKARQDNPRQLDSVSMR